MSETCPLCGHHHSRLFHQKTGRDYFQCEQCQLVFVPKHQLLSAAAEKEQYDLHINSPNDEGYRRFLSRTVNATLPHLTTGAIGLDFGCGPGPTLSLMFKELGFEVHDYDPIYFDDRKLLNKHYDFICSTEVIEHIYWPLPVVEQLWHQINSSGLMVWMTKRVLNAEAFKTWHYHQDPTHVRFYSEDTFLWLANHLGANVTFATTDIAIFHK